MATSITAGTTVNELIDAWLDDLRRVGRLEGTTVNEYDRVLRKLVAPALGATRLDALTLTSSTTCSYAFENRASTASARRRS
jgi:hypothetical protein